MDQSEISIEAPVHLKTPSVVVVVPRLASSCSPRSALSPAVLKLSGPVSVASPPTPAPRRLASRAGPWL